MLRSFRASTAIPNLCGTPNSLGLDTAFKMEFCIGELFEFMDSLPNVVPGPVPVRISRHRVRARAESHLRS